VVGRDDDEAEPVAGREDVVVGLHVPAEAVLLALPDRAAAVEPVAVLRIQPAARDHLRRARAVVDEHAVRFASSRLLIDIRRSTHGVPLRRTSRVSGGVVNASRFGLAVSGFWIRTSSLSSSRPRSTNDRSRPCRASWAVRVPGAGQSASSRRSVSSGVSTYTVCSIASASANCG
jgi:hypothetical protein